MSWVVFNDSVSNYNIEKPPMGKKYEDELKCTLSQLKKEYPVNTPEVYLVYQVFAPELLGQIEIDFIDSYFNSLKETINGYGGGVLHVVKCDQDLEEKLKYLDPLMKCKSLIKLDGDLQKRKKKEVCRKIFRDCFDEVSYFRGSDHRDFIYKKLLMLRSHAAFVREFPWLIFFDSEEILHFWSMLEEKVQHVIDLNKSNTFRIINSTDDLHVPVNNICDQYLKEVGNASVEKMKSVSMSNAITFNESISYLNIFRMVLLYNVDVIIGCNNKDKQAMIYKDFDKGIIKTINPNGFELDENKVIGLHKVPMYSSVDFGYNLFGQPDDVDDISVIAVTSAHCYGIRLFCEKISKKIDECIDLSHKMRKRDECNEKYGNVDSGSLVELWMNGDFFYHCYTLSAIKEGEHVFQGAVKTGIEVIFSDHY